MALVQDQHAGGSIKLDVSHSDPSNYTPVATTTDASKQASKYKISSASYTAVGLSYSRKSGTKNLNGGAVGDRINLPEDKSTNVDDGNASALIKLAMTSPTTYSAKRFTDDHDKWRQGEGSDMLSLSDDMDAYAKMIYHSNNLFSERELDLFNKTYRYGYYNTQTMSTGREFLFFTKPDLNIFKARGSNELLDYFKGIPFWADLAAYRPDIIKSLQWSASDNTADYFCHLLQNQCKSNLDIPGLSAQMTETAVNDYGVGYNYRGSSEASDDNPDFSLEFKDNKWLDVFMFFKAYEYYETMKHHGQVAPRASYIENRIIHDQFSIYKFIVAEDLETIVYYGKMYGVTPKSLPRDAFSNATFDEGISYNIDFQAAFYEDMIPDILADFNTLNKDQWFLSGYHDIGITNTAFDISDGRAARVARVFMYKSAKSPSGYVYKLKWRGDDTV